MPGKRVRISNEVLNSYGTRVITAGGDLEMFRNNPVLLYMHERGNVIGIVENLSVENDELLGDLVFDEASEISQRVAKQWEKGSLRMVSAGIQIIEMSDDESLLVQGQTSPTITKWRLREVSVVDIGANPDAIRLYDKEGELLTCAENGSNPLPKISNKQKQKSMDQKQLALQLGLAEDATEQQIQAKIAEFKASDERAQALKQQNDQIVLAAITTAVETAINEKRLVADKKQQFIELGQKVGLDDLKSILNAMQPAVKVSQFVDNGAQGADAYKKLSEVPADKVMELREKNPEQYKALYKAEYGVECEL